MEKRWIFSVLLVVLFSILSSFCIADEIRSESAMIDFTTSQVYPEPVEPGEDVTVKVTIKNQDELDAEDVKVLPKIVYPFQLKSQEADWWRGFNLCAQCTRENTYYILIDSRAESGTYPLIFDIVKGPSTQTRNINIKVQGTPDVILLTESNKPILVEPKKQFPVDFILRNIGSGIARNLKVISDSDSFITSGSNTQFVESLDSGKTANVTAYFTASDELEPDVYNVPIDLEYRDAVGTEYDYEGRVGVIVRNKAEISVKNIKTRPSFVRKDDKYELSLRVENTGSGEAKNVQARITTSSGDAITQYIGQLEKDEDASVVTSLVAKNPEFTESVINRIEVEITYEDDLGSHKIHEQLMIEVFPATKYLWYVVYGFLAVFTVLAIVFYYVYEQKKEQMENRFEEVVEYGLADEFVRKHKGSWSKKDFREFLKDLRKKRFDVDPNRLRRYLEKVRVEQKGKK